MSGRSSHTAFLGLGGNLGDPERAMASALRMLDAHDAIWGVAVSSLYRTPPWGKTDQPDFLNCAAKVETSLTPRGLLDLCLQTERRLKRERRERWGPRLIDIDVLVFGSLAIREAGLELPHPRMLERAFVLMPLAEIAPNLRVAGQTVRAHLSALNNVGIVRLTRERDWWCSA